MRILILGAGKMGSFFTDILSFQHETAVFDVNPHQLRFVYNTYRFTTLEEIKDFEPELVINAATVKYTLDAFRKVLPVLPKDCIISDIASVKTGLKKFYEESGFRYVSSHPMFGPTFASLSNLSSENAIIISEGDHLGKIFFKDLYQTLRLNIFEYTFDEHDETVAYSLSIPFVSTFVFAAVMKHQEAPGTTFKKHMAIAKGLLSEDDYLLQEILFNPRTPGQVANIRTELKNLLEIIENKDAEGMKKYLTKIRPSKKFFAGDFFMCTFVSAKTDLQEIERMIDQATIDRILDAAQIMDVVSDFVTLRKRGVNYVGLCPFHNDKTPSFYVSPAKGLCKCFACGKGGNAVHFIMEHEQMSYPEALRYLAKKYNIEIKERELSDEEKFVQSERESLFIVNNFARDYFQNILKNHVDGRSIGMAYFRNRPQSRLSG